MHILIVSNILQTGQLFIHCVFNDIFQLLQTARRTVPRTCHHLKPYKRMTSSWWRVVLRTAATGRQSWDGSTQVTTSLMTTSPWQPTTRQLLHSWRLKQPLVYTALRSLALLTLPNHQHLYRPMLLTYRVTRTRGRHLLSMYSVSELTCCNICQ